MFQVYQKENRTKTGKLSSPHIVVSSAFDASFVTVLGKSVITVNWSFEGVQTVLPGLCRKDRFDFRLKIFNV